MSMKQKETTWRKEIAKAMTAAQDSWDAVVASTLSEEKLDEEFYPGYGEPFTLWTETRVYFPVVYDGLEWAESVPRNPCYEVTYHCGSQ